MEIVEETLSSAILAENWCQPGDPYGYAVVAGARSFEAARDAVLVYLMRSGIDIRGLNLDECHVFLESIK